MRQEQDEIRTQRERSQRAKMVQQEALKQYEGEKEKKIYAKKLQIRREREAIKGAQGEQQRRNEELIKVVH